MLSHPLDQYHQILEQIHLVNSDYLKNEQCFGYSMVEIAGMIISSRARVSPKGRYLQAVFSDHLGSIEITFFEDRVLHQAANLFDLNIPLVIKCEVRKDEGGIRVTGQSVSSLDEYLSNKLEKLTLMLSNVETAKEISNILNNKANGMVEISLKLKIEDKIGEVDLGRKFKISFSEAKELVQINGLLEHQFFLKTQKRF